MADVARWLRKLGALNVSRSKAKGPAPNKPLLILAILDLAESGLIGHEGQLHKDAQLQLRFRNYTPICAPRRGNRIDLDLPWQHLASDGFYVQGVRPVVHPYPCTTGLTPHASAQPQGRAPDLALLDSEFHQLLADEAFRLAARKVVITTYFPPDEQVALYAACGMDVPSGAEIAKVREDQAAYKAQLRRGRCARFASQVISGHRFTCALTGYRLTSSRGFALLEAAHIQAHASRGPDVPENGLALTPTAHELFDAGLWTIDRDLRVVVARGAFEESLAPSAPSASSPSQFLLKALHGRPLYLPGTLRPAEPYLAHHRTHTFHDV